MKKLEIMHVVMAVLYLTDDLHSDVITSRVIDSDLSELGYKGATPERSINAALNNSKKWSQYFSPGSYKSHFSLKDKNEVLQFDDVRLALYAIREQQQKNKLQADHVVECTFSDSSLLALRNYQAFLENGEPTIRTIRLPKKVAPEDLVLELPQLH
nr:hypothetical protein [uncultured Desulfobulbus sp.]